MSDDYLKTCSEDEITDGDLKTVSANGVSVLLVRYDGKIYALEDCCTHDGAELSDGDLVEGQVQCSRHGARFDLKTGEATQMPAIVGIETFKVEIRDGDVYVAVNKRG